MIGIVYYTYDINGIVSIHNSKTKAIIKAWFQAKVMGFDSQVDKWNGKCNREIIRFKGFIIKPF